jgi:hypothetical protein
MIRCLIPVLGAVVAAPALAMGDSPEMPHRIPRNAPAETLPLDTALAAVRAESGFQPASPATAERAERVFGELLAGEVPDEGLAAIGLVRRPIALDDGKALAVHDPADAVRGRGFYLVQDASRSVAPVFLQAPHRFKDLDTGAIAAEMAAGGTFRMVAWNTVPRWAPDDRSDRAADLAHRDTSHFNAATAAFARADPSGVVVQLHGFASGKRRTAAGRSADVIVSSGTKELAGPARRVRDCLRARLGARVLGYGEDVSELGATTNRNAAMLRDMGFNRFVHVEMDRGLRRALVTDADQRSRLRACLLEAAE